ncbi:MAG: adenylosuccinate lyase [Candidatus Porifericomitaceae bacterium WSBS_2022_MAG_OTU9]
MKESALYALSPLDGRYYLVIADVRSACSEYSLIQRRLRVEVAWFKHLCGCLPELSPLSKDDDSFLQKLADDEQSAIKIKEIEESLRHDVKAVEVFLAEKLKERPSLAPYTSFLHFACTSEDINNLCYGLMLKELRQILLSDAGKLVDQLTELATATAALPMLARTHGQPASPTTMGKEMAVFVHRLHRQLQILEGTVLSGKFNGATGNYNAHLAAYPKLDWPDITSKFIESLGLQPHPCTTQVEPQDDIAAMLHAIVRVNNILLDACRDFWGYISLGYFKLAAKSGEVGSSTMPHKVNPIDFENAEGNLGIANALLSHLADNLPLSRWQRDLSGSTRLRNIGVAAGHTALAWRNMARGLGLLEAHGECMRGDLSGHTEVLTEAVQTVMRKHGMGDAYEKLKQASRGTAITEQQLHALIDSIDIPEGEKQRLRQLSPQSYTGNAELQAKTLPK